MLLDPILIWLNTPAPDLLSSSTGVVLPGRQAETLGRAHPLSPSRLGKHRLEQMLGPRGQVAREPGAPTHAGRLRCAALAAPWDSGWVLHDASARCDGPAEWRIALCSRLVSSNLEKGAGSLDKETA